MTSEIHTYLHCRRCLGARQEERLELGLTRHGILVSCPEHGQVAHFTPEQIAERVARGPQCDCCSGGRHRP